MSTTTLTRLAACAGVAAGVLILITEVVLVLLGPGSTDTVGLTAKMVRVAAFVLLLLGLLGLYARQAPAAGRLGLAGFLLAFLGTVLIAGDLWFEAFAYPFIVDVAPGITDNQPAGTFIGGALASFAAFVLGWALFGVASIRTNVLSRTGSVVLVVGALAAAPTPLMPPRLVLLAAAVTWVCVRVVAASKPTPGRSDRTTHGGTARIEGKLNQRSDVRPPSPRWLFSDRIEPAATPRL